MAITASMKKGKIEFSGRSYQITEDKNKALEPFGKQLHHYGVVLELSNIMKKIIKHYPHQPIKRIIL